MVCRVSFNQSSSLPSIWSRVQFFVRCGGGVSGRRPDQVMQSAVHPRCAGRNNSPPAAALRIQAELLFIRERSFALLGAKHIALESCVITAARGCDFQLFMCISCILEMCAVCGKKAPCTRTLSNSMNNYCQLLCV